jgi:hypothetical protein
MRQPGGWLYEGNSPKLTRGTLSGRGRGGLVVILKIGEGPLHIFDAAELAVESRQHVMRAAIRIGGRSSE